MVIINGKVFNGNVTIVNGRVIGDDPIGTCADKTVDERKVENSDGIRKITIRSNVHVKVSAENIRKNVEAHLHGSYFEDGKPNLLITRRGDEIFIAVEVDGMNGNNFSIYSSNSVIISSCGTTSGLNLDVLLPAEMFEEISIESKNNNIDVTNSVRARNIRVDCKNGNVDVSATFQQLGIDCKNGNIDVNTVAQSDIQLCVVSKNGNVDVSVENIGTSQVYVESKNGSCKNSPRLRGRYTACGSITSKNGNVKFK